MRSEVIEGLTEKFGPPSRKTKKSDGMAYVNKIWCCSAVRQPS